MLATIKKTHKGERKYYNVLHHSHYHSGETGSIPEYMNN